MNKTNTNSLSQGQLVHALKRRVRIIAPVLQKDPERAYILEILLKKRDGILAVRTVPDIASVTINFDPHPPKPPTQAARCFTCQFRPKNQG